MDLVFFPPAAALMHHNPPAAAWLEPLGFPSLPTALDEQLGLRLEPATASGDAIVIDYALRP